MKRVANFKKIVSEGKAMAYVDGKAWFVTGGLPGEVAEVELVHEAARWASGRLVRIVEASEHRREPLEAHFMSCAPWQGVDYDYQLELKRAMLAEILGRPELRLSVAEMVASPHRSGYRNKLEFAWATAERGELVLALHDRGSRSAVVPAPDGCALGMPVLNRAAIAVAQRLNALGVGAAELERLIVRAGSADDRAVAVLRVRPGSKRDWWRLDGPELAGLTVVAESRRGEAKKLWIRGSHDITERVGGVDLTYAWQSFFQINPAAFELALERILDRIEPGTRVVDLYGGVGAIGIPAARVAATVTGLEIDEAAVTAANRNVQVAGLTNYRAEAVAAERLDAAMLAEADTVIVDPPRAGLDGRVVAMLRQARPRQIIYLSCNPVTQARDIMALQSDYVPSAPVGFDFYPGTLHLESLVVLTRR